MLIHDLGMQIRALRKEHKMTQTQLAQIAGISRVTLGKVERGEFGTVSLAVVDGILRTFGYELSAQKRTSHGLPTLDEYPNAGR
ncbi:helix-turn-helix domain-containing protein [Chrysiogenes arsenatis]|uniref:helix-turn-helix domain-containing protein n=1 Tax=Chrysiogenes arsenatis TaxID=309797 RepID=UPI00041D6EAC|nr:helix-turn-helix transcriptional regulator [Chrysiogenes arsenatis]